MLAIKAFKAVKFATHFMHAIFLVYLALGQALTIY